MNFFVFFLFFFLGQVPKELQELWSEIDSIYIELGFLEEKIENQEDLIGLKFNQVQGLKDQMSLSNNKKNQLTVVSSNLEMKLNEEYLNLSSILNSSLREKNIIPRWFSIFGYEENLDSYQEKVTSSSKSILALEDSLEKVDRDILLIETSLEKNRNEKGVLEESLIANEEKLSDYINEFNLFEKKYEKDILDLRKKRDFLEKDVDAETILTYRGSRWELPLFQPAEGRISSSFDPNRLHPVLGYVRPHNGQDIAAPKGTPVYAAETGRVIFVGEKDGSWAGLGKFIMIQHDDGWETRYAHLSKILIDNGKAVKRGDKIGLVGSTGLSTGPHLHFETRRNNIPYDPMPFLNIDEK